MRPRVTLKLATSLDGRIATAQGESRWITGEEARAQTHLLRAAHDCVLVGIGTVLADDPELSARTQTPPPRQPLRVVLDTKWRTPLDGRLAATLDMGPVLALGGAGHEDRRAALAARGFAVGVAEESAGVVDVRAALAYLNSTMGVTSVFVEGGGQVAASFVAADLVDALEWFRAPVVLGGDGVAAIGPLPDISLAQAPRFARIEARPLGADVWERYQRMESPCSPAS